MMISFFTPIDDGDVVDIDDDSSFLVRVVFVRNQRLNLSRVLHIDIIIIPQDEEESTSF